MLYLCFVAVFTLFTPFVKWCESSSMWTAAAKPRQFEITMFSTQESVVMHGTGEQRMVKNYVVESVMDQK